MSSRWRDPHPRGVSRWLGLVEPRVLPRLERQAAPAGGARAVRLRAGGLHPQPLGGRGDHLLLRRPAGAPDGLLDRQGVPEGPRQGHRDAADHPRPPVQPLDESSFDAWIKFYRRDENSPNAVDQLLHQGGGRRLPARRQDPPRHRRPGAASTTPCGSPSSATRESTASAPRRSGGPSRRWPGSISAPGCTVPSTPSRSSTTRRRFDWYGLRFAEPRRGEKKDGEPRSCPPAGWVWRR